MNNLQPPYKFLLATFRANPDDFLETIFNPPAKGVFWNFDKSIQEIARYDVNMNLLPKLNDEVVTAWEQFANSQWESISNHENKSPFEFLKRTVDDIMILNEGTPHFKMGDVETWNNLTFQLGEDLFAAVLFANRWIKHGLDPQHFQWNYILRSNFFDLNSLLKREKINENHYHLFGSPPNVDLSWLFLMNHPNNQEEKFTNLEKHFALEQTTVHTHKAFKQTKLYYLVKIAACLRVHLFEKCCLPESDNELLKNRDLGGILSDIELIREHGITINDPSYDEVINVHRTQSYYRYKAKAVDYAIRNFEIPNSLNYAEIAGERHLYYACLKHIFNYSQKEKSEEIQKLFYLYLLIKHKFNGVFIQRNSKYGFDNFQKYQEKKSNFIKGTFYQELAVKMAIKYNISENYIDKLELRITPEEKEEKLRKSVKDCDTYSKTEDRNEEERFRAILNPDVNNLETLNPKHFYVIHFIKNKEMNWGVEKDNSMICVCRESKLRSGIKKQAIALNELRKNAGKEAFRIYGIDAASHEVNCRPEIFGQVFRYLSNSNFGYDFLHYNPHKIYLPHLKKTYHAGEDFYDIIDGLRAIDEAVLFLHLKHGDRIGHGVALGLDPEKYYNDRPHIAMPLQNALDNYAWILYCIEKLGVNTSPSFYAYLQSQFDKYFNRLYNHTVSSGGSLPPDLQTYIKAWKLRGDNPACYSKKLEKGDKLEDITRPYLNPLTEWDRYALCYRHKYDKVQENVYDLYHSYHFDNKLKKEAAKIVEIEVKKEYIELVKQLQVIMRNFVLKKGVAVESNPSSNFLISNLDKTIELPVFKLFPVEESESDFVRLNVSVNTDDQAVFYTSLVKEYTLLAGALQKESHNGLRKYSNDKILNWIQHLIANSKNQCFMQEENV